jgi:hypothetical protein
VRTSARARFGYTSRVASYILQLDDTEIKMLLVAIKQVQHTFTVAEAQSLAAGEPLAADYEGIRTAYERLHAKLAELVSGESAKPFVVK